jgi:hypothetical protein
MSRGLVGVLLSLLLVGAPGPTQAERAAAERRPALERPRLAVVVVDRRRAAETLRADQLIPSLEAYLHVDVGVPGTHSGGPDLGLLSVMLAPARAELIWTLPDGRTGLARVRADVAGDGLLGRLAAVARSMFSAFGMTEADARPHLDRDPS